VQSTALLLLLLLLAMDAAFWLSSRAVRRPARLAT
jgi:hypothetical protein